MGSNYSCQLGSNAPGVKNAESMSPVQVVGLEGKRVIRLSCGGYHSVCSTDQDEVCTPSRLCSRCVCCAQVYVWGQNSYGQLGLSETTTGNVETATLHPHLKGQWAHFANGMYHGMALDLSGKVWSWGDAYSTSYPCCGHGIATKTPLPKVIEAFSGMTVVQIGSSNYHSIALTSDGKVWTWGYGQRSISRAVL